MHLFLYLLAILLALCSALPAQTSSIQEGHDVLLTCRWGDGIGFLGGDASFLTGPDLDHAIAVAYDPTTDTIFVVADDAWAGGPFLYAVDPHTHAKTLVGSLGNGSDLSILACHPTTGELYYMTGWSTSLYHLDKQTADLTYIGTGGPGTLVIGGAAFHPESHELIVIRSTLFGLTPYLVRVSTLNGSMTELTPIDRDVDSLVFDEQGRLFSFIGSRSQGGFELVEISATGQTQVVRTFDPLLSFSGLDRMPPTSPTLTRSSAPAIGGQESTFAVTGARADARIRLAWSTTGPGSTFVPQLGLTLGIASPFTAGAPMVTGLDGRARKNYTLPPMPGTQIWVQAVQAGVVTNVETFTIQ